MQAQSLPSSATEYARAQRREIRAALNAIAAEWSRMGADFDASWRRVGPSIESIIATAQARIAVGSVDYLPEVLEETGQADAISTRYAVDPRPFVGVTGSGLLVPDVTGWAPVRAKQATEGRWVEDDIDQISGDVIPRHYEPGKPPRLALQQAGSWLSLTASTILSDTGRQVERAGMLISDSPGYVRMLVPPSCARCAVLAGRWYRNNAGFQRHPNCDCRHIPAPEGMAGDLTLNVGAYFDSLDDAGRLKFAGSKANLQAIEDGADPVQIVNAYRRTAGMKAAQVSPIESRSGLKYTREAGSDRALATQQRVGMGILRPTYGARSRERLMPESIAKIASTDAERRQLLRAYGWIRDDAAIARGRILLAEERRVARNRRARARRAEAKNQAGPEDVKDLRAMLAERSARRRADSAAGSAAGGSKPPNRPRVGTPGPEPDPSDRDAFLSYWKARQDALEVDFKGETLEPHEVRFVERFTAIGHRMEWIARDERLRPTNDFRWLDQGGIAVELKSTRADFGAILSRITNTVSRASRQGVVKANFVVDLGDEPLTAALREQLGTYNQLRTRHPIQRLWVMHDGQLEEIALRA